jgi:thioredoxin reductase
MTHTSFDAIIVGGSYAGLSAAMSLGRALRRILIIDSGLPCNRQTPHSHNFITHDGEKPAAIAAKAREQVLQYPTVRLLNDKANGAIKTETGFEVQTQGGETFTARKLLFATGLSDLMPEIAGFAECWGISILHCPYCHGYEYRSEKTGILGNGEMMFEMVKLIFNWTSQLVLFTNGPSTLTPAQTEQMLQKGIRIVEKEIGAFAHEQGQIREVVFQDGSRENITALYARPTMRQHCELPAQLGCELTEQGLLKVDFQKTTVPGIYATGDNSSPARSVAVSVAAGMFAGAMMNKELLEEDFAKTDADEQRTLVVVS